MPEMILTHKIGSPAWGVALSQTSSVISTAGVATTDRQGTAGVTACLHGVVDNPENLVQMFNAHGSSFVIGKQVYVDGNAGVVRKADLITDSCFVTEVDLPIPFVSAGEQAKVYTQPVTNPGDSGSALVNDADNVLGFSHRRTGLSEPMVKEKAEAAMGGTLTAVGGKELELPPLETYPLYDS